MSYATRRRRSEHAVRRKQRGPKKLYANDVIEVHWEPRLCIHTRSCIRELGEVFDPAARPWVGRGRVRILDADSDVVREDTRVALCRCGASDNKPFCDGSHRRIGFTTGATSCQEPLTSTPNG